MTIIAATGLWTKAAIAYDACLGAPINACLDALAPFISDIDHRSAKADIEKYEAGDINGQRKRQGLLTVNYHSRYATQFDAPNLILFNFSPDLRITQIEIMISHAPSAAETEDEYNKTHMYEATLLAFGDKQRCDILETPHNFYSFFHNKVKPGLQFTTKDTDTDTHRSRKTHAGETGWVNICGKLLKFNDAYREAGRMESETNPNGWFSSSSLVFRASGPLRTKARNQGF